jgi:hypothetical protein
MIASGLPTDFGPSLAHITGTVNADLSGTLTVAGNTYPFGPAVNPIATAPGSNLVLGNSACGGGPFFFDNLAISNGTCQLNASDVTVSVEDVDPISQLGRSMQAMFTPSSGLSAKAAACGFTRFNWQQTVDVLPCPSSIYAFNPADRPTDVCLDRSLKAPPKFYDPLPGGYSYPESRQHPFLGASPFYYNPVDVPGIPNDVLAGCAQIDEAGICIRSITNSPVFPVCTNCDTTLNFSDNPADHSLLISALDGNGSFVAFTTSLVGVKEGNIPTSPIVASDTGKPITWSWKTDYDGFSGGVSRLSNNHPVDPGSGSGGITITSIGGIPQTPPSVSCSATPNALWPPNGKSILVTVSGTTTPGTQAVPAGGTKYATTDEYGQAQPSGSIALGAGGRFSFGLPLIAARDGSDKDGRKYTITISAKDQLGNVGLCSVVVRVPHDQGH